MPATKSREAIYVRLDRKRLRSGTIPVPDDLARLLPRWWPSIPLTLTLRGGPTAAARWYYEPQVLRGADLPRVFSHTSASIFLVTVIKGKDSLRLVFAPAASPASASRGGSGTRAVGGPGVPRKDAGVASVPATACRKRGRPGEAATAETLSLPPPATQAPGPEDGAADASGDGRGETGILPALPDGQALPPGGEPAATGPAPPPLTFRDQAWDVIRAGMEAGAWSAAEEEWLHWRAATLSTNPGFETLLSLNVIRNAVPFPYQVHAVRDVLQRMRGRALLCDEVGLGKTIEAGLVVTEYLMRGLARRVLVLCPPSLVEQWADELRGKFNLDFVLFDDPRFRNHPDPWSSFHHVIASLDTVKREPHRSRLLQTFFDCVVVDEAHRCRNRSTQNWAFVNQLQKKYILLLTATPVQNSMEELYNLITLLRPGQLETPAAFARAFITRGNPMQPRNVDKLRQLMREVMIRNRRSDCGVSLPRRHAETILVELGAEEAEFYRGVTEYVRREYAARRTASARLALKTLQREAGSSPQAALPTLARLAAAEGDARRRAGLADLQAAGRAVQRSAKVDALITLLRALGKEKVIVFTGFRPTQEMLAAACAAAGIRTAVFHGEMRRQEKEQAIEAFRQDVPVLISTESGGEGRNLQFCHIMVNFDLPWNPMRIEQRIGRLHRIGQTEEVYVYNLAAAGTIEARILELLDAKINLFELVVGELDMILGDLVEGRDFEDLIMDLWAGASSGEEVERGLAKLGEALRQSGERYRRVQELEARIFGEE